MTQKYQLALRVELADNAGDRRQVERSTRALCTRAGRPASVRYHDWRFTATPFPVGAQALAVRLVIAGKDPGSMVDRQLQVALGKTAHVVGKSADGRHTYRLAMTPLAGCPARVASTCT